MNILYCQLRNQSWWCELMNWSTVDNPVAIMNFSTRLRRLFGVRQWRRAAFSFSCERRLFLAINFLLLSIIQSSSLALPVVYLVSAPSEVVAVCCCARSFLLSHRLLPIYQPRKISVSQDGARSHFHPKAASLARRNDLHAVWMLAADAGLDFKIIKPSGRTEWEREKKMQPMETHARRGKKCAPLAAFPLAFFASDIARNRSALFIKSFAFIDGDKSCQQSCRLLYFIVIYFAPFYYCRGKQIYHKICEKTHRGGGENF